MINLNTLEVWFVTGSQHLYGEETLKQVEENSKRIAAVLDDAKGIPVKVVFKEVLTTPEAISQVCLEANNAPNCIGLITWMHTFSPAKMWIAGLKLLFKPFVHLHTQFFRDLPWSTIDMDYMNLHQSAHGGREFGFIGTRLHLNRKVIVGHYEEGDVQKKLSVWVRAAAAWHDSNRMKIARFGDNMREVAVTEGNKVSAQIQMGYSVSGYGMGDLVRVMEAVSDSDVETLVAEYKDQYHIESDILNNAESLQKIRAQARIEAGMRAFLEEGGFQAFTTTFEDLHGLKQLPGLAVQRLMAEGYGFGAEGDWKTAALVRSMKVMAAGLEGGTSFMEDYTYHFDPIRARVLGAHMLEVCPSIADGQPSLEVHALGIGGKEDPARLVFNVPESRGVNASMIDLGNRFRLIINPCDVVAPDEDLPRLPVARVVWVPEPDLKTAATSWILAGGAHHTGFSTAIDAEYLEDFAEMSNIEHVLINQNTIVSKFKQELKINEVYYSLSRGLL